MFKKYFFLLLALFITGLLYADSSQQQQHCLYKNYFAGMHSNSVLPGLHFEINVPKDDKFISSAINFLNPLRPLPLSSPTYRKGVFVSGTTINTMYCSPFISKSDYFYISSGLGLEVYFKRVRWERVSYEDWNNKTFTYVGLPLKISLTKLFMNSMAFNFAFKVTFYKDEPTMIGFNLGLGGWVKELRIVKKY